MNSSEVESEFTEQGLFPVFYGRRDRAHIQQCMTRPQYTNDITEIAAARGGEHSTRHVIKCSLLLGKNNRNSQSQPLCSNWQEF